MTGKSTIAYLLKDHITFREDGKGPDVKVLSTNSVLHLVGKYTNNKSDPILHAPVYKCGHLVGKTNGRNEKKSAAVIGYE